jgi:uncharacterized damage-inducible protein DinB
MTWTAPFPDPIDGPLTGPDRPMLSGYLDWQRATLLNICAGLTADELAIRPFTSTNLSLLGLVRHLAKVERTWFRLRLAGEDVPPLFEPGTDDDFELGTAADAHEAVEALRLEQDTARANAAAVSFDDPVEAGDEVLSVRMVHVHMIGEYARHNGHADLIRQALDGVTAR